MDKYMLITTCENHVIKPANPPFSTIEEAQDALKQSFMQHFLAAGHTEEDFLAGRGRYGLWDFDEKDHEAWLDIWTKGDEISYVWQIVTIPL